MLRVFADLPDIFIYSEEDNIKGILWVDNLSYLQATKGIDAVACAASGGPDILI